jgi:hypothetical protein
MYSQTANKTKGKKAKRLATEPRAVAAKSFPGRQEWMIFSPLIFILWITIVTITLLLYLMKRCARF